MNPLFPKLKNLSNTDKVSIGVDIGTASIKMVKLKFSEDAVELAGFNLSPMEQDLTGLLKKFVQNQEVNISVSGASTVIRYIEFPRMTEDELRQSLKFEAQKYIPFPTNEVQLDSCLLKETL